eukprot:9339083-Pyramimonas_sp.AAC.1
MRRTHCERLGPPGTDPGTHRAQLHPSGVGVRCGRCHDSRDSRDTLPVVVVGRLSASATTTGVCHRRVG